MTGASVRTLMRRRRAQGELKGVTVERSEASIVRIIEGSNP